MHTLTTRNQTIKVPVPPQFSEIATTAELWSTAQPTLLELVARKKNGEAWIAYAAMNNFNANSEAGKSLKKLYLAMPDSMMIDSLKKEMKIRHGAHIASQLSWEMLYRFPLATSNAWVYRYWRGDKQKICVDAIVHKTDVPLYVRFCQLGPYSALAHGSPAVKGFVAEALELLDTDRWEISPRTQKSGS